MEGIERKPKKLKIKNVYMYKDEDAEDLYDRYLANKSTDSREPSKLGIDSRKHPAPVVVKIGYPTRAMIVVDNFMFIGSDRGEVKMFDKDDSFTELATKCCADDPVSGLEI